MCYGRWPAEHIVNTGKPQRIQRRRAKGWKLPANTVCVDRSTKWGNPFIVGRHGTRAECVKSFQALVSGFLCISNDRDCVDRQRAYPLAEIAELKGKNLACWCPPGVPCHGQVLLEVANRWKSKDPIVLEPIA